MSRWFAVPLLVLASAAGAQAPPSGNVRLAGVLTAASSTSITVKTADGTATTVALAPPVTVLRARPVDIEAIKPGTYVATANTNIDANSGKSIELRMYEPTPGQNEFSRPMAQANTTMTNGTVQTIRKGDGGRELDVAYPGGVRHIVVPPDVQVIGNFPAALDELKPGVSVTTNAARTPAGDLATSRVTITPSR